MSYQEQVNQVQMDTPADAAQARHGDSTAFAHLAEMHLDEVANLWTVWRSALTQPHYDLFSLQELERRIQNHIAGMRLQENIAWSLCRELFATADAAEMFAAAQLAFRSYDVEKIKKVVEVATATPYAVDGLVTSMAWLPSDIVSPWIEKFLGSRDLFHKYLAVEACRIRGVKLDEHLSDLLRKETCLSDERLLISVLRSIGETKCVSAASLLATLKLDGDAFFWHLYAQILLGDHRLSEQLYPFVGGRSPVQGHAAQLAFRLLPLPVAQKWISDLIGNRSAEHAAITATAILGDPQVIPWLVGLMHKPEHARLAGQAFSVITGCDLERLHYVVDDAMESLDQTLLREATEEAVDISQEGLAWPDADVVWTVWQNDLSSDFKSGYRYFQGEPMSEKSCLHTVRYGRQFERLCAAYELALIKPDLELYNVRGIQYPEY